MSFFDSLDKYSDNVAIIQKETEQINYKNLLEQADEIGNQTPARALVFMLCSNTIESVAAYLGFLRAKSVPVLINHIINKELLLNLLDVYKPEYIYLPKTHARLCESFSLVASYGKYSLLKTSCNIDYSIHENVAQLLMTSGTTGSPKLVKQTYRNISSNASSIAKYLNIKCDDRPITTMPMSYSYGLSILNSHFIRGAAIILTEATVMDRVFWELARTNNASTFGGVPYIYEILKKLRFGNMEINSLKYLTQAGGRLSVNLVSEFADICSEKGIAFYVMYGQTEATARMSYLPYECIKEKQGSIGVAIPDGNLMLMDSNQNLILDEHVVGQLIYEGENVSMGYAENRFDLKLGDKNNGKLYTGDLAKRDADGYYYIAGRMKRFVKVYGNRVNLDELEGLIRSAGYNCACTGSDDNLKIYITQSQDEEQIESHIMKYTGINRAGFSFVAIGNIPRNSSGKIQYSLLN